jgi:hypothetical protein
MALRPPIPIISLLVGLRMAVVFCPVSLSQALLPHLQGEWGTLTRGKSYSSSLS